MKNMYTVREKIQEPVTEVSFTDTDFQPIGAGNQSCQFAKGQQPFLLSKANKKKYEKLVKECGGYEGSLETYNLPNNLDKIWGMRFNHGYPEGDDDETREHLNMLLILAEATKNILNWQNFSTLLEEKMCLT